MEIHAWLSINTYRYTRVYYIIKQGKHLGLSHFYPYAVKVEQAADVCRSDSAICLHQRRSESQHTVHVESHACFLSAANGGVHIVIPGPNPSQSQYTERHACLSAANGGVQRVTPGCNPGTPVSTKRVQLVIHRNHPASPF